MKNTINNFEKYLLNEEKSKATVKKYIRDVKAFFTWISDRTVEKSVIIQYKEFLTSLYAPASVNSVISSLNHFFMYNERYDLRIKSLKIQKRIFSEREKELSKQEYERLLIAAKNKKNRRLFYVMQTICSTGMRVSELKFVTVEAVKSGVVKINCKGKMRQIFLPKRLCRMLSEYLKEKGIKSGIVFATKNGKSLDRSNIWSDMKSLCEIAGVSRSKVFPHNLRHLFARTYYSIQKDIVRLADILGHSSVNTTRIYTIETGEIHRMQIQKLGLLMC